MIVAPSLQTVVDEASSIDHAALIKLILMNNSDFSHYILRVLLKVRKIGLLFPNGHSLKAHSSRFWCAIQGIAHDVR